MLQLRRWLHDHSVEDILRSRRQRALYVTNLHFTLRQCLVAFQAHHVHNLLIRLADGQWRWQGLRPVLSHLEAVEERCEVIFNEVASLPICHRVATNVSIWDLLIRWSLLEDSERQSPLLIESFNFIEGVLTVADVLHYIYIYGPHLSALMDRPTHILPFDSPCSQLIPDTKSAEEGLANLLTISSSHGSGKNNSSNVPTVLGVIDRKGVLIAQLTLMDFLPAIMEDNLYLRLRDLIALTSTGCPPVICCEKYSFGSLLRKVHLNSAHHVWRVDVAAHPVGVVQIDNLLEFVEKVATGQLPAHPSTKLVL